MKQEPAESALVETKPGFVGILALFLGRGGCVKTSDPCFRGRIPRFLGHQEDSSSGQARSLNANDQRLALLTPNLACYLVCGE
jgi:hypothetical protein